MESHEEECETHEKARTCEVGGHDEVVLDNEAALLGVHDEPLDHLSRDDALLRVQVRARLVDQVDVGGLAQAHSPELLPRAAGQLLGRWARGRHEMIHGG